MINRYTFKSGHRTVTAKGESYDEACSRARASLDYRMERKGVEAPVAHTLHLVSWHKTFRDAK